MAQRPRSDRLIVAAIGLVLLAAGVVYYVLRHASELKLNLETDRIVLGVLVIIMSLLVVALLVLLLRNLIKLLVERRHNVLGSRFRTKLVFIFLILVLIPSLALFWAAVNLILDVNENLFVDPLEQITADAKKIVDAYNHLERVDCARFAESFAAQITEYRLLELSRSRMLETRAADFARASGLDFVEIYGHGRQVPVFSWKRPPGDKTPPPPGAVEAPDGAAHALRQSGLDAMRGRETTNRLDRMDRDGTWQRVSAAAPVHSGSPFNDAAGAVVVGRYISPDLAGRTAGIDREFREYRNSLKDRPNLKRIYILLFAILTLLVTFAATWTGFYLARQITVPIQALAEGTREISAGNLDYRVTAVAGDEIGFLIQSFNRMTQELRSSRQAIDASRNELEESYQQLEERRLYIEQLLENVPAAVISLDERGRVTTMNRAAYRILRLDPARPAAGLRASEVFDREELRPLVNEIEDLPLGEAPAHVQEFEFSVQGRAVHLAANLSARRDAEGRFQGALIVMEDLTPLIRAQRTAAWREVARRIAHEIKNPLTPIQLSAQRILKKFHEGAPEFSKVVEEGVHTIVDEVTMLKSMVDEFSRFARMPTVALVPSDPVEILDSALMLYEGIHPGIRIERDVQPSLPVVRLDKDQMKRALTNLIDNAIAALEGSGTVTLRARVVEEDAVLRIEIEDDGPGIGPEDKERLFVPYFSTKKRGTGLGLAIVNRIVSDHNGFIRVEDNQPRGTRFVIDLPLS